jgi:hypothetical protein
MAVEAAEEDIEEEEDAGDGTGCAVTGVARDDADAAVDVEADDAAEDETGAAWEGDEPFPKAFDNQLTEAI